MNRRDRQILQIAVPAILSNITVPLLGLADIAIVGHLGSASYIGAIAVGGMAFNIVYWMFGFLRMGTSGITSQALGRRDLSEAIHTLIRSMLIGWALALCLLLFQHPVREVIYRIIGPDEQVLRLATAYYDIGIWGAPATLGIYSLTGWFIGMQNSRAPMLMAVSQNLINIALSLCLVFGLGMKVEGVAAGTVAAQYAGLLIGLGLWKHSYQRLRRHIVPSALWQSARLKQLFFVNRDIFLRTCCLVAVMLSFTSIGARQGELILAANTLLMQLYLLYSYVMDGFAFAGEALAGKFIGAGNLSAFCETLRRLTRWAVTAAVAFTLAYFLLGNQILHLLTNEQEVVSTASAYLYAASLVALTGTAAFVLDGVFIGATATLDMLLSVFLSALLFFGLYFGLRTTLANHGLWVAYNSFLAFRGVVLYLRLNPLKKRHFGRSK